MAKQESKDLTCTSCKTKITNLAGSVRFTCPNCDKEEIIRCNHCRKIATRYICGCGFSGPN